VNGYGKAFALGRSWLTHRLAWTLAHGAIPARMCVLHHCDRPACVNPDHLFLGTQKDNLADMRAKHRGVDPPHGHGPQHPRWRGGKKAFDRRRAAQARLQRRRDAELKALHLWEFWQQMDARP